MKFTFKLNFSERTNLGKKLVFLAISFLILSSFTSNFGFFASFNLPVFAQNSEAVSPAKQLNSTSDSNSQNLQNSTLVSANNSQNKANSEQTLPNNSQNQIDTSKNLDSNSLPNSNPILNANSEPNPAQTNTQTSPLTSSYDFYQVKVIAILSEEKPDISLVGANSLTQKLKVMIIDKNQEAEVEYSVINAAKEQNKIKVGDNLIVSEGFNGEKKVYNVIGFYRINSIILIIAIFFALTVLIAGFKGIMAFVGLLLSIMAIAWWLVPSIIAGFNPFWACILVAVLLAFINLYLAHGFRTRTSIALVSVLLTLAISAVLAPLSVMIVKLFGVASDEAFYLQAWEGGKLDLQGLFLGGIIIGTLGVLDDVATAQSATVEEIANANPSLTLWALYNSGMSVGREHILSMINTLALAYVGVSLPMILSFVIVKGQPWWAILSSDLITEEIVRTLVGSVCLIIAVPICNFLASLVFCKDSRFGNWTRNSAKFGTEENKIANFSSQNHSQNQNLKDKIMNLENKTRE